MSVCYVFYQLLRALLKPRLSLVTENLALRQQLVILRRNTRRPGLGVIEIACFGLYCRICGATGAPSWSSSSQRQLLSGIGKASSAIGAGSPKLGVSDARGLIGRFVT
ncbi:MAG: hypothetical protein H0T64_13190 [Pyrinomonadaceae bacterium]|nr:hypothetical protein [Pyrinomonadaceae bacterium]